VLTLLYDEWADMNLKAQRALRIAVLECDTPLPETKKKFQGYGGVFKFLLESGAKALSRPDLDPENIEFSFWQVELNPDKYPDPNDIDAILITGSSKWYKGQLWSGSWRK
jgi:hypothetical protein